MALKHPAVPRTADPLISTLWPLLVEMRNVQFRHSIASFVRAAIDTRTRPHRPIDQLSSMSRFVKAFGDGDGVWRYSRKLFCSEAIALIYQRMGMLDSGVKASRFVPGDFGPWFSHKKDVAMRQVPWVNGWHLEPLLSLSLTKF
jgi:hypothetical protein